MEAKTGKAKLLTQQRFIPYQRNNGQFWLQRIKDDMRVVLLQFQTDNSFIYLAVEGRRTI